MNQKCDCINNLCNDCHKLYSTLLSDHDTAMNSLYVLRNKSIIESDMIKFLIHELDTLILFINVVESQELYNWFELVSSATDFIFARVKLLPIESIKLANKLDTVSALLKN